MKKILPYLFFLFPIFLFGQMDESDILGIWLNEKKEAVVEIYKKDNEYFGVMIDIVGEHAPVKETLKDLNNPKPEFKDRPLLNMPLLENLKFEDGEYINGTAYNPRMGKYFNCKAWLISKTEMKIRGYWGFLFATETWSKHD